MVSVEVVYIQETKTKRPCLQAISQMKMLRKFQTEVNGGVSMEAELTNLLDTKHPSIASCLVKQFCLLVIKMSHVFFPKVNRKCGKRKIEPAADGNQFAIPDIVFVYVTRIATSFPFGHCIGCLSITSVLN